MKVVPLALNVFAALLATLATILYVTTRSARLRAEAALEQANARIAYLDSKLSAETTQKEDLQKRLTALDAQLGATKVNLTAAELRVAETVRDLAQARSLLTVREQNEQALTREIADLRRQLVASQQNAAELERYQNRVSELEQTVALLQGRAGITAGSVFSSGRAQPAAIVTVGPENAFVVINYGSRRGAKVDQALVIRRGTETLATVLISDVRDNFSIAQVEPASLRGALRKGDSAVITP